MLPIAQGQNYKILQEAFSTSYSQEAAGNYSGAIETLKAVYDEDSYELNLRLGWLHYSAGLFTESLAYYGKSIKLMPYAVEARMGYALPASAMGNTEMVKAQFSEILKIDPQNSNANYKMGTLYYGKGDYATAEKYFEKILNLWPFDFDALLMSGWTKLKQGKFREAEVLFNKALLNRPNNSSALEGLGLIK
ncbi:MAG: tetratricopeptide repeat protein [Bacteroidetes bacterium]|nr:tetratricopeptide repeat protein [Bacteroidota bacterium]